MTAPTKSDLIAGGYRMSANAPDNIVARCADEVLHNYLLAYVTRTDVDKACPYGAIGRAWSVLTFLRYMQDEQFATRTGGERKRFDYGEQLKWLQAVKNEAATRLADLYAEHTVDGEVCDVCGIYFKTQFFN